MGGVTKAVEAITGDPSIGRSEALRLAMLAMIAKAIDELANGDVLIVADGIVRRAP